MSFKLDWNIKRTKTQELLYYKCCKWSCDIVKLWFCKINAKTTSIRHWKLHGLTIFEKRKCRVLRNSKVLQISVLHVVWSICTGNKVYNRDVQANQLTLWSLPKYSGFYPCKGFGQES